MFTFPFALSKSIITEKKTYRLAAGISQLRAQELFLMLLSESLMISALIKKPAMFQKHFYFQIAWTQISQIPGTFKVSADAWLHFATLKWILSQYQDLTHFICFAMNLELLRPHSRISKIQLGPIEFCLGMYLWVSFLCTGSFVKRRAVGTPFWRKTIALMRIGTGCCIAKASKNCYKKMPFKSGLQAVL